MSKLNFVNANLKDGRAVVAGILVALPLAKDSLGLSFYGWAAALFIFCCIYLGPIVLWEIGAVRRYFYSYSRAEGWWFQAVGKGERPFSISHIKHTGLSQWTYAGTAYGVNGDCARRWISSTLGFDDSSGAWILLGKSSRSDGQSTGNVLSVLYMRQHSNEAMDNLDTPIYGRIHDMDSDEPVMVAEIKLYRIPDHMWRSNRYKKSCDLTRESLKQIRSEIEAHYNVNFSNVADELQDIRGD